jgi:EAL domain-containing protein (putative c-di-GMP-specific phosphodiesterase class I)
MGLQVALDHFGTGYSSLSHLKRFDIDYVKIDQAFAATLEADTGDLALCEAIIAMAHKLGLQVVAEGVETGAQRALLQDAGCDFAQGFMFGHPMPAEQFEAAALASRQ